MPALEPDRNDDDEVEIVSSTLKECSTGKSRGANRQKAQRSTLALENAHYKQMVLRLQAKHRKTREELKEAKLKIETQEQLLDVLRPASEETLESRTKRIKEALECGICFDAMWSSFSFSECGHSFCASCVKKLVGDRQFRIKEEETVKKLRGLIRTIRLEPHLLISDNVPDIFHPSKFFKAPYSCPSCRKGVFIEPVENFSMKAVMDSIAEFSRSRSSTVGTSMVPNPVEQDERLFLYLNEATNITESTVARVTDDV